MPTPNAPPIPRVRAPRLPDAPIPRWWFFDNPYSTHGANALHLLFPEGERFFIRSVMHFSAVFADDPELRARVRGFVGQEGRHGVAHDRFRDGLEAEGYAVRGFVAAYRHVLERVVEPSLSPVVRLAATAALEHVTATLAGLGLSTSALDDVAPPMRELLLWHGAEEVEHRSVTFDVLARVDPRLRTRLVGMAVAAPLLAGGWWFARGHLLRQETARGVNLRHERRRARADPRAREDDRRWQRTLVTAFRDYVRRSFHPEHEAATRELAREHLSRLDASA